MRVKPHFQLWNLVMPASQIDKFRKGTRSLLVVPYDEAHGCRPKAGHLILLLPPEHGDSVLMFVESVTKRRLHTVDLTGVGEAADSYLERWDALHTDYPRSSNPWVQCVMLRTGGDGNGVIWV